MERTLCFAAKQFTMRISRHDWTQLNSHTFLQLPVDATQSIC
jgi:hypothetical protein